MASESDGRGRREVGRNVVRQGGAVRSAERFVAGGAAAVIIAAAAEMIGKAEVGVRGILFEVAESAGGGIKLAFEGGGERVVDHAVANGAKGRGLARGAGAIDGRGGT
jgi:hypothetical protein